MIVPRKVTMELVGIFLFKFFFCDTGIFCNFFLGNIPPVIYDVICEGKESSIFDCGYKNLTKEAKENTGCNMFTQAGVQCQENRQQKVTKYNHTVGNKQEIGHME